MTEQEYKALVKRAYDEMSTISGYLKKVTTSGAMKDYLRSMPLMRGTIIDSVRVATSKSPEFKSKYWSDYLKAENAIRKVSDNACITELVKLQEAAEQAAKALGSFLRGVK